MAWSPPWWWAGQDVSAPEKRREQVAAIATYAAIEWGSRFWLGDLLTWLERLYGTDMMLQMVAESGRNPATFSTYKWVAEQVPAPYRREDVNWSCTREVAHLAPDHALQAQCLAYAAEHNLTVRAFNAWLVQQGLSTPRLPDPEPEPPALPAPAGSACCPHCGNDLDRGTLQRLLDRIKDALHV